MIRRKPLVPHAWRMDFIEPWSIRRSPLSVPAEGICDPPHVCIRVNVRWAAYVGGALHILEQPELWKGTEADRERAIQEVRELLDNMACSCGSQCDCGLTIQINATLAAQLELTLEGLDDGTVESFAPDAPDTTWDTDSGDVSQAEIDRRQAALCWAIAQFVAEVLRQAGAQIGVISTIGEIMGGILVFIFPVAGLIMIGLNLLGNVFFQALIEDNTAIQKVICCIFDGLTGEAVNFENFRTALDECGFEFGTNEAQLAGVMAQLMAIEGNYRIFTRFVGQAFTAMEDDFDVATCICEECWTESGTCSDRQCIETLDGTYDCTSFDQSWESVDAVNPQRIETTIRFPSTYVRRTGLVTDAFIGVVNKVLNIYVNGDAATGELIYTEPFTEDVPTFRETLVERTVDQITWEITADPAPTNGIRCFNQTICSRDPVFPLVTCEP